MTTTNVYQGIGDGSRVSSKVLKPPGGGSSNIFGDPEPPRARPGQQQQQTNVLGQPLGGAANGGQQEMDVAYGSSEQNQNNAASRQLPAGVQSSGPAQDGGRFAGKKQEDSFNNIFGGEGQQQGQRGRRKGDVYSADRRMEVNTMAFNDHGNRHDDNLWAQEEHLQEQRRTTLALNRHHAKAPVTDTYSNLFGDQPSSDDSAANKRRLANTVSEYNIITGILNTPQMKDHTSPQSANFTSASGSQRNRGTFNPITGEDYEHSPQAQQRNVSRVTNPPGGKSQGLW